MKKKLQILFTIGIIAILGCVIFIAFLNKNNNILNNTVVSVRTDCYKKGKKCTNEEIYNGVLVNVSLSSTISQEFYIISDTEDSMTLLMNASVEKTTWSFEEVNIFGPNNLLFTLYDKTKDWTNIDPIASFHYDDTGLLNYKEICVDNPKTESNYKCSTIETSAYGYSSIDIENGTLRLNSYNGAYYLIGENDVRARLITREEIDQIFSYSKNDYIPWLNNQDPFWTATSSTSKGEGYDKKAYAIINTKESKQKGFITAKSVTDNDGGIRPVITIDKQ